MSVIRPWHEVIGAYRVLANRKTIISDRLVGQVGDALEYLGAPDLKQRGRRSRVDPPRHLGDNTQLRCLQCEHIELDARDILDEFPEGRIVLGDLGLYDLLEAIQVTRRTADARHAGALVAEQEFCVRQPLFSSPIRFSTGTRTSS